MTTINTIDGSTLRDNLITSHQVDHMSPALSDKSVENNQEHLVANKLVSITSLV